MPKSDIYTEITDKIIQQIEAGVIPWACPWNKLADSDGFTMPENPQTGRTYSGVNIPLLWCEAFEKGYPAQRWLTYKQAEKMGGQVRKGEKSTFVVYADQFIPKDEKAQAAANPDYSPRSIGFLKKYSVFNVAQIEGLEHLSMSVQDLPERQKIERAEQRIQATGAVIRIGGDKAFYRPSEDAIQMPHQAQFRDQINYYRTAFHELGHWTGHESRLDRNIRNKFGSKDYAREELVAEMASAFVCASLNIKPTVRHADYVGSWLKVLKEDNRAIVKAASMASKASDYILTADNAQALAA